MKQESVRTAENHLPLTNTAKQNAVPCPAQTDCTRGFPNCVQVKSIRYVGRCDVYNMEVDKYHNFAVNGGLIVHNCIDAVRYACEDDMRNVRVV